MKNRLLDIYFKAPVLIDYVIAVFTFVIIALTQEKFSFSIPEVDVLISVISDLSNVALTISGFILTLLTLLITFKSSSKLSIKEVTSQITKFEIFFASDLYYVTNRHLKNSIKSLLFLAIIGYVIKLTTVTYNLIIYFFSIALLVVLVLTIWRCLLILGLVLNFQKNNSKD